MYGPHTRLRHGHLRHLRSSLVLAVLIAGLLCYTAAADAAIIKTWRTQPVGTLVTEMPVIINGSGSIDGVPLNLSTLALSVDGVLIPRSAYTASTPYTRNLYVYYLPQPPFTDGIHTVRVQIADALGRVSAYQWSVTVGIPPKMAWVAPTAGSQNYDGRPEIAMTLSDNTPGTTFNVAGQVHLGSATGAVVAGFGGTGLSAGTQSFLPSAELSPGTYYLTATVTDAAGSALSVTGNASRSFSVVAVPPMTMFTAPCGTCHDGTGHPATGMACSDCHLSVYHEYQHCEDCHAGHSGPVNVTGVTGSCRSCHDKDGAPKHTKESVTPAHAASCSGCHNESLLDRHTYIPEGSTYSTQCDLCHESTDPDVVAAITSGNTSCSACHDGGHEAVHTPAERTDGCATCHAGASLTIVHLSGTTLTCDSCHASTDPEVVAAIAANNLSCSGCHVTAGVDYHVGMEVAHTSPVSTYYTCSGCHHSWSSNPLRGHDITRHEGGCATCHNASTDLTGKTALCSSCHITEGEGSAPTAYHRQTVLYHSPADPGSLACARCHQTTNVRELHTVQGCQTCHNGGGCMECHRAHNAYPGTALLSGVSCSRCHTTEGTNYHVGVATAHASSTASCQGADCHTASLIDLHADYVAIRPEYEDTCALCHVNPNPARIPETATSDCTSCHSATSSHGDEVLTHTAVLGSGVIPMGAGGDSDHGADWSTYVECASCHNENLIVEHVGACALCHGGTNPAGPLRGTWTASCQQGNCHVSYHIEMAPDHNGAYYNSSQSCFSCHIGPDLPSEVDCSGCHTRRQ